MHLIHIDYEKFQLMNSKFEYFLESILFVEVIIGCHGIDHVPKFVCVEAFSRTVIVYSFFSTILDQSNSPPPPPFSLSLSLSLSLCVCVCV